LFPLCFWINEVKDLGLFIGSENSVLADAVTAEIVGVNPEEIAYLQSASEVFGGYKATVISKLLRELECA
jgi:uncharacterized protein (DUF362 family)